MIWGNKEVGYAATKRYSRRKQSSAEGRAQSKMLTFHVPTLFFLHGSKMVTVLDHDLNIAIVKAHSL